MQFEVVRLIQTSQSLVHPTLAENKVKGSNWHRSYAFAKLQKLFEQYYIDSANFHQTGSLKSRRLVEMYIRRFTPIKSDIFFNVNAKKKIKQANPCNQMTYDAYIYTHKYA